MPITGLFLSAFFIPWILIRIWLTPLPDTVQEQVNDAIDYGLDGIIVYVDQSGQKPAFYTAGFNNRDAQTAADPHSLFKIASISKLYIAAATTKLVAANRLSLDQTLADYLPDFADRIENADRITLRMLVRHRSGIPDYSRHPDYPWTSPFKENDETYELVWNQPADFEPDTQYEYSNTNYLLLGEILDRTLGYRHHQYITDEVLEPLGLTHTFHLLKDVNIDSVMSGYFVGYELDIKRNDFIQPGGSMVATIRDVGIFIRALNTGTLLTEEEQVIYSSIYNYGHTGLLPGYQSFARYYKEMDMVVVQFNNTSGGYSWNIAEMVLDRIVEIVRKPQI